MAQQKNSDVVRSIRILVRKYGLSAKGAIIATLAVVVVVVGAMGSATILANSGMRLERGEQDFSDESQSSDPTSKENNSSTPERALVHVDGAVASPGVYILEGTNKRVNDAVLLAGGLTEDADTSSINLAEAVSDGQKIHIPAMGESAPQNLASNAQKSNGVASGESSPSQEQSSCINVNTATIQELCELPGVGETTAAAIIEDREANGPFASADDLTRVSGIGEKKLAKIRDSICV